MKYILILLFLYINVLNAEDKNLTKLQNNIMYDLITLNLSMSDCSSIDNGDNNYLNCNKFLKNYNNITTKNTKLFIESLEENNFVIILYNTDIKEYIRYSHEDNKDSGFKNDNFIFLENKEETKTN